MKNKLLKNAFFVNMQKKKRIFKICYIPWLAKELQHDVPLAQFWCLRTCYTLFYRRSINERNKQTKEFIGPPNTCGWAKRRGENHKTPYNLLNNY